MPAPIPPNGEFASPVAPLSQPTDLRALLQVLTERLWIILLLTVASLLLAAGYLNRAIPLYSSTATLQVEQEEQKIIMLDKAVPQEDLRGQDVMETIVQTLKARSLLERVIDTNGLAADPRFLGGRQAKPSREQLVRFLASRVDVRLRLRTRLIDVTVVHRVPEFTDRIANSIVREFMQLNTEQSVSSAETANVALLQEAGRLKKKLQDSENALQAYREATGSVSLDQRQDIVGAKLKELSTRVTEAKSARIRIQSELAQLEALGTNIQALMVLPVVANDPKVVEIQTAINKLGSDLANLRQRYKEKHPKYIQAVSEIEQWRIVLTNAVLEVRQTRKAADESAKASEEALSDALRKQETAAIELNQLLIHYHVLAREVESDRALYEAVLNQMKQTSVTKEAERPTNVKLIQLGYRPESPFSPRRTRVLLLGLLSGLFGGILLVLGLNALDDSFKTVDQVEGLLHLPVLGAVPTLRELRKHKSPLIIADSPHSAGAEAFRTLRTSVTMLGKAQDRRSFIITSALPSEGKTFTSLNFAASLAQQGLRTLVIDGDLRKPSVREYLGSANDEAGHAAGVTDYLTGQKQFQELVCPTALDKLFYISAGTLAPNPAELLAQGVFSDLVKEALQEFDRVVVDSAPIHAVSDTLLMVGAVNTVCLVVRAAKTARRAVVRSIKLLRSAGAALSGIVLNCLPRRHRLGYGYYYYNPYYDYAYYGTYSRDGVYGANDAREIQPGRDRQDKMEQTSRNKNRTE